MKIFLFCLQLMNRNNLGQSFRKLTESIYNLNTFHSDTLFKYFYFHKQRQTKPGKNSAFRKGLTWPNNNLKAFELFLLYQKVPNSIYITFIKEPK